MKLPISHVIKKLRKDKNITQETLANALGVTYQSVSRWENDVAYPDIELIPAIASYFDVTTDVLFGTDKDTIEGKLKIYNNQYDNLQTTAEKIALTKKFMEEMPKNVYLKWCLCQLYIDEGFEVSRKNIDELRSLCQYVIENSNDFYRDSALRSIICVEDDDKVSAWISLLNNGYRCTLPKVLQDRYFYRNEVEKYNKSIQKNLVNSLERLFSDNFCKRDKKTYKYAASRVEGQKIILKIIDTLRNPRQDIDAWIEMRAFTILRLAAGSFGCGLIDEGYQALESSMDLYVKLFELPDDTMLSYNSPVLDLLSVHKFKNIEMNQKGFVVRGLLRSLTNPKGWEWFNVVRNDQRYKAQIDRIREYIPKDIIKIL